MRTPHLLRRASGDAQPRLIVCVQADGAPRQDPEVPSGRVEVLRKWSAVCWRNEPGRPEGRVERSGGTALSWWREMDYCLSRGVETWVFSLGASRVATLLGFFKELEGGEIYTAGRDPREGGSHRPGVLHGLPDDLPVASAGRVGDEPPGVPPLREARDGRHPVEGAPQGHPRPRPAGYLVLEDPPCILCFRRRGRAGRVRWLCLGNYGIDGPALLPAAATPARRTEAWVRGFLTLAGGERMGTVQNTAAGQCWTFLKRSHLTHAIQVHCHPGALALEREAYLGGRCEAFRVGRLAPPVYNLDFRAHYATCYTENPVPVRLRGWEAGAAAHGVVDAVGPEACIADVTVQTDSPDYPCVRNCDGSGFPVALEPGEAGPDRGRKTVTFWPVGRFRTQLCGPELAHAVQAGRVVAVHRVACYYLEPALVSLGEHLARLRARLEAEGRKGLVRLVKAMGVGIVGRFGMRMKRWIPDPEDLPREAYCAWRQLDQTGNWVRGRCVAEHSEVEVTEPVGPESVPAIAAWACSLGRLKLLRALACAGRENVYYVDTDSLVSGLRARAALRSGGMLDQHAPGRLREEGVYGSGEILGWKHYRLGERYVCAGLPSREGAAWPGDTLRWVRERLGGACRAGRTPRVRALAREWSRKRPYCQGRVTASGVVEPWEMWEV